MIDPMSVELGKDQKEGEKNDRIHSDILIVYAVCMCDFMPNKFQL